MIRRSFTLAVEAFTTASPWLGLEHAPAVTTLWALAETLDQEISAATVSAFGVTYRSLAKLAPVTPPSNDPLSDALEEALAD